MTIESVKKYEGDVDYYDEEDDDEDDVGNDDKDKDSVLAICLAWPVPGDDNDYDDDGNDDDNEIAMMMTNIVLGAALNGLSDVCGQNIALDIVLLCSNCIAMVTARWW